jgi:hypothetical protein
MTRGLLANPQDLVDAGAAEALYGEERDMAFEEAVAYVLRRE